MKKLSTAQQRALIVIRQNGNSLVANGVIASRNRVTFATLCSLERLGKLSMKLTDTTPIKQWEFTAK